MNRWVYALGLVAKTTLKSDRVASIVYPTNEYWTVKNGHGTYTVPVPAAASRLTYLQPRHESILSKYTDSPLVSIEPGDVVVDVGAFIGSFSLGVLACKPKRVIAIEPDPRNFECLRMNLQSFDSIELEHVALWNEETTMSFDVGNDPSESSLLGVDEGGSSGEITVPTTRLDSLDSVVESQPIDFLKVEAEGAEIEILEGIGDLQVNQIAVDCSPERDGKSPLEDVMNILSERQYAVEVGDEIVFAKLNKKPDRNSET